MSLPRLPSTHRRDTTPMTAATHHQTDRRDFLANSAATAAAAATSLALPQFFTPGSADAAEDAKPVIPIVDNTSISGTSRN